jgi:hypothetical protein
MQCPAADCQQLFDDPDVLNEHYAVAHLPEPDAGTGTDNDH